MKAEGGWLLREGGYLLGDWRERIEHLLEEAFVGMDAREAFRGTDSYGSDPVVGRVLPQDLDERAFLEEIVEKADRFPSEATRRPYWPERHSGTEPAALTPDEVRRRFVRTVEEFREGGYLDQAFPTVCVDDRTIGSSVDPSDVLQDHLGVGGLWPLPKSQAGWDQNTFYGLIEVVHDLVARPRSRSWHDWNECGWHWSDFAALPGQALYRWRVNQLLDRSKIGLRLADNGDDVGRLVATTDDARSELASAIATRADPATGGRVRHAQALFRARGATEHDKRSAVVELAGVLEERRDLLKVELYRKGEGALFQIANEFALRHQRAGQQADYDPAFLEWIFWWYLGTIELTDRILARQGLSGTT